MRISYGAVIVLALAVGAGCASRDDTASTPPAAQAPAGGGAQPGAGAAGAQAGAGAQAAARVTPEQLEAAMKGIQQTNGAVQKAVKGNMLMEAATNAKQLATLFAEVERFFQQNSKPDAVMLAQTARIGATDTAAAAAAGDQVKAATAATTILGTCAKCHGVYREGDAKTGFRIRAGTITP
jgi:cytochrome c556